MAISPSWIENKKERFNQVPWMELDYPSVPDLERDVIKVWQNDPTKDYARWMCGTRAPGTFGSTEYGDAYVHDVLLGARLVNVLGEIPTPEQIEEFYLLQAKVLAERSPSEMMGL